MDTDTIVSEACRLARGRNGKLRASYGYNDALRRARAAGYSGEDADLVASASYYVWRLARFHGGADTRMPVLASVLMDKYTRDRRDLHDALDAAAEGLARETFGTDMGAAFAWGRALGYL